MFTEKQIEQLSAKLDASHVKSREQAGRKLSYIEGFSPVAPKAWVDAEPYMRCVGINGGLCPVFAPRKQPKEQSDV